MSAWIRDGKVWKILYALTETKLERLIRAHEERGWQLAGEIQQHGRVFKCLMTTGGIKRNGPS